MLKVCTDCLYVGVSAEQSNCNLKTGIKWFVAGLISISLLFITPYFLILSLILILKATAMFESCFTDSPKCPKCDEKAMISINKGKAKRLIDEHNLIIPDTSNKAELPKLSSTNSMIIFSIINGLIILLILGPMIGLVLHN